MGFIYFDIKKWLNKHNLHDTSETDYKKIAAEVIDSWERGNNAYHFDGFVLYEEEIIPRIRKEIHYDSCFDYEYWEKKTDIQYSVFCILDEFLISYDYFLSRAGEIDCSSRALVKYLLGVNKRDSLEKEAEKIKFHFIVNGEQEKIKMKYSTLKREMALLEVLSSDWKADKYEELETYFYNSEATIKKKLNTGKYSVKNQYEKRFNVKLNIFGKGKKNEELKLLALFYHLEKIGIPKSQKERRCIFVCDILKSKKLEHINKCIYNVEPLEVALDIELFKNEIIKHIDFRRILFINERIRYLYRFFLEKSNYLSLTLNDSKLTRNQVECELIRIKELFLNLIELVDKIDNINYEENIFEFTFMRYQKYIFECERDESFESLKFVLETKAPKSTPFFEKYTDDKIRYECINLKDIDLYIDTNIEEISIFVLNRVNKRWVRTTKNLVHNLIELMKRFNRTIIIESIEVTILLSMFQSIKEVQDNRYRYNNNYRNYNGNKEVSLMSKLKDMSDNTKKVESIFDYLWMGLLKKWFMHNECKYDLWKISRESENNFNRLMCKIISLNNINDIDNLIKALDLELKFPFKKSRFEYETEVKKIIYLHTKYALIIEDFKIFGYFDYDSFFEEFTSITPMLINCYDRDKKNKEKETYHIKLRLISIKVVQDFVHKTIKVLEIRIISDYKTYKDISNLNFTCMTLDAFDF